MYSFKQLELFISLAKSEKVVETAKSFSMSQSAVSMAIRELEKELDEQLFDRIGKRLVLNNRGQLLLDNVQSHIDALKHTFEHFSDTQLMGELHIAASATIADYVMPTLLHQFLNANEQLKIRLKKANSTEVAALVKRGECDMGFVEGEINDVMLMTQKLLKDELVVVSSDPTFQSGESHYIDQLLERRWILREEGSGTRSVFLEAIAPLDSEINIYMEFENTESIKSFLLSDKNYISALPKISVIQEIKAEKLFVVNVKNMAFSRDFLMIQHAHRNASVLLEHFKAFVQENFEKCS